MDTRPNSKKEYKPFMQQFFQQPDYSQTPLLHKLNIYLAQQKRLLLDATPGYCHGITLLWLYKMAEGEVQWFYEIKEKILNYPPQYLCLKNKDIDKFIDYIEWGQNSIKYTYHSKPRIDQSNIDKILDIPQMEAQHKYFTYLELYDFLKKHLYQNKIIVLSCTDKRVMHTIGLFVSGPLYFLFDPNYSSGKPTLFSSPLPLINEIRRCMYTKFNQPLPLHYTLLKTHVFNSLDVAKKSTLMRY